MRSDLRPFLTVFLNNIVPFIFTVDKCLQVVSTRNINLCVPHALATGVLVTHVHTVL